MTRTTENAVKAIIEVDAGVSVLPFIEAASALVDDVCVPLEYDATRLELIERWLSAHLFACANPRVQAESAGPVSATYQARVDLGLDLTAYGQQVKLIDTKGGLAALDYRLKKGRTIKKAKVTYVGVDLDKFQDRRERL